MSGKFHSGFAGFMDKKGLSSESQRLDDSIVISIGRSFRIYCRPASHGDLVLESRLIQLPDSPADDADLISRCLLASWIRMGTHSDVPVLSENSSHILLQQRMPSDATVEEVELSLENFVNSIVEWRRVFRIL